MSDTIEKTDITALGELLIDLTQSGTNELGIPVYTANPGGAPANLLVAARRLSDSSTCFIGKVGSDSYGKFLRRTLDENAVGTAGLLEDPHHPTTLAVVSVDEDGERSFSFYRDNSADVNLRYDEIPQELLENTKIFHFGSVSLTTEPARTATLEAARTARKNGAIITYDPNYRERLWPSLELAVQRMREPLDMVDILKVSEEEMALLTCCETVEEGSADLASHGIRLVLVTLGAKGAFYRCGKTTGYVPGIKVKVADTNGAGDTFFGAVLGQLRWFDSLDDPVLESEMERIVTIANMAAAYTTSRPGAIPAMPTYKDLITMR